ncbi:MAG TPA: DUF5652 family protein [Candidatus Pacearchaeota archaeon]|nr:DUF5652 family protein [Candidatus Pacearchaeota archaeon]
MFSIDQFLAENLVWVIVLSVWTIIWMGWALWKAARQNDKLWFVVLLVVNTLGLLEILYIFFFSKREKPIAGRDQKTLESKPE